MISQIPLFLRSLDRQDFMMKIFHEKLVNTHISDIAIGFISCVMDTLLLSIIQFVIYFELFNTNSRSNILNQPNVNQENKTE